MERFPTTFFSKGGDLEEITGARCKG